MDDAVRRTENLITAEDIVIGERSSRLSSTIVFFLFFIPVFATVLFGGVDNTTWVLISLFWFAMICLWAADTWKGKGLLFNPSMLQVPLLGIIAIGLVQLLPLGNPALSVDPFATRSFVTRLVVYAVFFAACLTFINNESRLKKTVLLIIIFGAGMRGGALAFARISHFGMPRHTDEFKLIHGDALPLWITAAGTPAGTADLRRHFNLFLET